MPSTDVEGWAFPPEVTAHQMAKWRQHAEVRLDLAAKYMLGRRNIAIQAGGNLGIWPYLLVKRYNFRQVLTFEPDQDNMEYLLANTANMPIISYQTAIGREKGTFGWLKDRKGRPGWHKIHPEGVNYGRLWVEMMVIDELSLPADHDRVDLIALDIEGYELNALMGAEKTLYRDKPVVIVEDLYRSKFRSFRRLGGMAYGYGIGELQGWLSERGYRCAETAKNDEIWVYR